MLYTRHKTLTDATLQTLFTVPKGYHAIISYIFIANHAGSTNQVSLYWDLDGNPELYIFDDSSLGGGDTVALSNSGGPMFVLHANPDDSGVESIKIQAGSSGNIEVAVTFELVENPAVLINFA